MSQLLFKTRCPACAEQGKDRSGDNLGVYDDGHSYCFSCGYSTGGTLEGRLNKKEKEIKDIPTLPEDIGTHLSPEAMDWLHLYYPDVRDFPICYWSEQERKLIFPIIDKELGYLQAWQYRYFGDNPKHPKWVGYGINDSLIHIVGMGSNSLVLVEDLISADKVGHITPTLCLFGSNISLKRLATLKTLGYTEIVIWLDWDKKEYAIKAAQLAQSIGLQARVIHTKLDPKEYDYESIIQTLEMGTTS